MVSTEELFNIIYYNDHIKLKKLINRNEVLSLVNQCRFGYSLIYKAIEYRARECFDILISLNNLTILNNDSSTINGLDIAVKYYMNAPNENNQYYLESLLSRDVKVSVDVIKKINNKDLFMKLLDRVNKKESAEILLKHYITTNKMEMLEDIYFWLDEKEPEFFNKENRKNFLSELTLTAIKFSNLEVLDILRSEKIDIKIVKDCNKIKNSLFYSMELCSEESFDYLLNFYRDLKQEEFDNIVDIKKLEVAFNNKFLMHSNVLNYFLKIINLNFDFGDQSKIVENIITLIFENKHRYKFEIEELLIMILLLGKKNMLKKNPFSNLINKAQYFKTEFERCLTHFKYLFTYRLKLLSYVFNYLNIKIPVEFSFITNIKTEDTDMYKEKVFFDKLNKKIELLKEQRTN